MPKIEIVNLNDLVPKEHVYRKILKFYPGNTIEKGLKDIEHVKRSDGYGEIRKRNV